MSFAASNRGTRAARRGLKTIRDIAWDLDIPESFWDKAPKAEWHHDLKTGARVWMYNPAHVWAWWSRKLLSRSRSVGGIPIARATTGAAPKGNSGGGGTGP